MEAQLESNVCGVEQTQFANAAPRSLTKTKRFREVPENLCFPLPVGERTVARMHSGSKGKSGSTKPLKKAHSWAPYKKKEVEKLVIKYSKMGKSSSEIGAILRDSYGIHSVKNLADQKITAILKDNNLSKELPEDLLNLIKKMISLKQHQEKNNHDQVAKRGVLLTSSKIRRLIKYYQKTNKLPEDWKFDPNRLKMYIE